ncbi:Rha family transcriptional regulator [Vibrio crassostreae]|uniref:Rha family transcriptional regulator n=1 Tax=Vibrio crassostreae TaxID=246167 RepID=UPI001B30EADB|nr:Rha family transcriptional regulator [Vibrio crassostreae]
MQLQVNTVSKKFTLNQLKDLIDKEGGILFKGSYALNAALLKTKGDICNVIPFSTPNTETYIGISSLPTTFANEILEFLHEGMVSPTVYHRNEPQKDTNPVNGKLIDGNVFILSNELADVTDKHHAHILQDIRKLLSNPEYQQSEPYSFESTYEDTRGRNQTNYTLSKKDAEFLLVGYSIPIRQKVMLKLEAMEKQLKQSPRLSTPDLLRLSSERIQELEYMVEDVAIGTESVSGLVSNAKAANALRTKLSNLGFIEPYRRGDGTGNGWQLTPKGVKAGIGTHAHGAGGKTQRVMFCKKVLDL